MGYSIPGADYTLPPLQVNVAAKIGSDFAKAIQKLGDIRRQERKEAKELLATQNNFKNQLLIQQNELKTGFFSTLNEAGFSSDGDQAVLFDQFSTVLNSKAKEAMEARVKMQFDQEITDDERQELAKKVADFNVYSKSSLTQIGGLVADYEAMKDLNMIVVGNPKNGEQLSYQIALQNIGNGDPKIFDKNAIIDTKLTEQRGNNMITSTVKIPANSKYFQTVARNTGSGPGSAVSVLQRGLDEGIIKEEMIDGRKFLVFKNTINATNYSKKDGMDLVVEGVQKLNSTEVFEQHKFIKPNTGAFLPEFIGQDNEVISVQDKVDSNGKPTGWTDTVQYNIINIDRMASDQNFLKDIDATYDSIFENSEVSRAVQENYLLQIGISRGLDDFDNVDGSVKKKRIMDAMVTDLFSSRLASSGDVDNAQMPFVLDPKNPVSQNLIDSAMASGFKNPVTQQDYKMGETIYVIRKEIERSKKEEGSVDKYTPSDTEERLLNAYRNPTSIGEILLPGQASGAALSYDPNSNTWQITKLVNNVRVATGSPITTEEQAKKVLKRSMGYLIKQ